MNSCGTTAGCLLMTTGHQVNRLWTVVVSLFNANGTWTTEDCGDLHHFICKQTDGKCL